MPCEDQLGFPAESLFPASHTGRGDLDGCGEGTRMCVDRAKLFDPGTRRRTTGPYSASASTKATPASSKARRGTRTMAGMVVRVPLSNARIVPVFSPAFAAAPRCL